MKTSGRALVPYVIACLILLIGTAIAEQPGREKEDFATTRAGIRIHYLETGDRGSKRALVLIPGWRLPAYLWSEQLRKFAPTIRVIAIDPRSQGESTRVSEDNTPEARARDLHDILATLGVTDPVLVGWSQGAQDVAAYLQQFGPDAVSGSVFVDSTVSAGPAEIELHRQLSKILLSTISIYATHPQEFSVEMVRSIFKKPHPDLNFEEIVRATRKTPTDTGIAMWMADVFGADRRAALTKLTRPCLVIGSAENPFIDLQKEMADSIPGAKFLTIGGTGHAVFVDEPQKFDDALGAFLQTLPGNTP